jgi:hypothetical protein
MDLIKNDSTSSTKKKEVVKVVSQLPTQEVRQVETETEIINFVTIEEYLTTLANARTQ